MGRPLSDPTTPPDCSKGHGPKRRTADSSRVQGWRWTCRECSLAIQRRSYERHREREIQRTRQWQQDNRKSVAANNRKQNQAKKRRRVALVAAERKIRGGGCEVCGSTRDLHWHHREPESKVASIARMKSEGFSLDALEAELAKCALLCHEHHLEAHHELT